MFFYEKINPELESSNCDEEEEQDED